MATTEIVWFCETAYNGHVVRVHTAGFAAPAPWLQAPTREMLLDHALEYAKKHHPLCTEIRASICGVLARSQYIGDEPFMYPNYVWRETLISATDIKRIKSQIEEFNASFNLTGADGLQLLLDTHKEQNKVFINTPGGTEYHFEGQHVAILLNAMKRASTLHELIKDLDALVVKYPRMYSKYENTTAKKGSK